MRLFRQTRSDSHRPSPNHPSQRVILEPGSSKHEQVKDLMRRAEVIELSWTQSFGESRSTIRIH